MEFFKSNSSVGFMRTRKVAYAISAIMFVVSIGALVFKGLNFGGEIHPRGATRGAAPEF
jgi:preprotein translocase subunit SecF